MSIHDEQREDVRPIQRDDYGQKAPKNWQDVRQRLHDALLRICVSPVELIADAFEGLQTIVRGVTSVPSAVAERIRPRAEAARQRALEEESTAQREQLDNPQPITVEVKVGELEALLQRLQAKGVGVQIQTTEDGRVILAMVAPDDLPAAIEVDKRASEQRHVRE